MGRLNNLIPPPPSRNDPSQRRNDSNVPIPMPANPIRLNNIPAPVPSPLDSLIAETLKDLEYESTPIGQPGLFGADGNPDIDPDLDIGDDDELD